MAYSQLLEDIALASGKFDKEKKYFINNWTSEDITVKWGAMQPDADGAGTYTIKAGELGGPYPQFLAYHICKHLVNRELINAGKVGSIANANVRIPLEEKTLRQVINGEEDPRVAAIRETERAKLMAEIGEKDDSESKIEKKRGRPKKEFAGANE